MNIEITHDKDGGTTVLTTDSSASHYGIPVLRIEAEDVSGDFGPADIIHTRERTAGEMHPNDEVLLGFHVVAGWLAGAGRTAAERQAGLAFLRQSPHDLTRVRTLAVWGMYRATGTFPGAEPLEL